MKKVLFPILIVAIFLSACNTSANTQAWVDLFTKNQAELPVEYTQSGSEAIRDWVNSYCTNLIMESMTTDLKDGQFSTLCREYTGQTVEMEMSAFALTMTASLTPIPFDDVVSIRWAWNADKTVKVLLAVAVAASTYSLFAAHTDPSHNPNVTGTQARTNIATVLTMWLTAWTTTSPNPPPDRKCGVVQIIGSNVVRYAIWIADTARPAGGYMSWFHAPSTVPFKSTPWGGSYDISGSEFQTGPSQQMMAKHGWEWKNEDCNNLPPLPPLQSATR